MTGGFKPRIATVVTVGQISFSFTSHTRIALLHSFDLKGHRFEVVLFFVAAKLHSLFIVTYDELDLPVGRDQSYAVIESMFFKPLWQWVNLAFR